MRAEPLEALPPFVATTTRRVPFQRPELPDPAAVLRYFERSRAAGFYSNGGPNARELASRIGDRLGGGTFAVPVANCTLGLMAALRAQCGTPTGPRREILTQSFTFTATACAIEWAGFEPVWVDVDPDSWCLDPVALRAALERRGDRVAGVLACATFGTAPNAAVRDAWRAACADAGVPLLLDSAPGFGATDDQGTPLGGRGDTEVFSFHATKPFAVGEGGAVVTGDPEVAARIARIINFGLDPDTRISSEPGLNAKMSELHSATALAALDGFDDVLARRRALAAQVSSAVAGAPVGWQRGAERSPWQFIQATLPSRAARTAAVERARDLEVESRTLHDPPLHRHPAFASRTAAGDLGVTEDLAERSISLPLANSLTAEELSRIAAALGGSSR